MENRHFAEGGGIRVIKEQLRNITAGEPKKIWKPIFWAVLANLVNMFPFGCMAAAVSMIYAYYSTEQSSLNMQSLWLVWGGMVVFLVLVFLFERMSYRSTYRSAYESSADGRTYLAEHMRKLPLGFLMKKDPGELGHMMMNDFTHLENAATNILPQLVSGAIIPILAFFGLLFMDWRMAVAMLAGFPVAVLLLWSISGLERKLGKSHSTAKIVQANCLQEYLLGMKVIKAYNLRGENFKRLEQSFYNYMKESIKLEGVLGPFFLVAMAFMQTGVSLMTIVGVYLILGGEITVPLFAMFLLVGTRVFDPLSVAIMRLPAFKYDAMAGERIISLLDEPIMSGENEPPEHHDIQFDSVTFGYDKNIVLDNVSVEMKEGTLTAIVGPSGSGKSTLLRLIARFYDPQHGKMLFGGSDVSEMDPEKLMKKISMVFQDVYLFQDTIRNNIRYGRENATQAEIEEAAKEACCHDFIMKLPLGYDTMVGEGGSTLSGGERQRISIARAILKNAPVILLDEATSSLDPENEVEMQRAISRLIKGRTVIMIAHRLKTVVNADRIIVLDKGKIVEEGQHEELIKDDGLYAKLWELQTKTSGWRITA
ncbi:ABC transporter ATP-binding protein [Brevibacillus laterosporus]|uniref:ABC transporter ATP-binding protein n=1 Tax=Brevibacillus laterosporus TaxID=1465 RepID=A0AAP3DDU8_BRELA|nr:ABC transporter ATP-binding protein [Brevibacillus laterosporus]MCR8936907.1 ABC transporter ATP-binding protein/permease [Brevibacillus laterosporus]MCR8979419.1 ABC transporter ATP-binding protein/permease [Brevibacillus laterosporus]MCZ0806574.1 ABC transporter ATP-binding protein [Brevibacillus laterosporus]MCZ0825022.1 ABC transporter ATP-binding protein [Brevibacillus laterosporus]MCZ0839545.1 ABC transporter ATP-binding protein [Brevibacillus laterosporus]